MKRLFVFGILQVFILAVVAGAVYLHKDRVIVLKKPPESIAKWYKPENKRQAWLHTMFKLRRTMQATELYAKAGDGENLQAWTGKFAKNYRKISEMVPEWQRRLDMETLTSLEKSAANNNFSGVTHALKTLGKSCTTCHQDFRAVTAALYRTPDFSKLKIAGGIPLRDHMKTMSEQVNQIKIAFVDGKDETALAAFGSLKDEMGNLGKVCVTCHKDNSKPYPYPAMQQALAKLESSLNVGTLQDKGKALGTLAVMACATCHSTHRLSYDTRELFGNKRNWPEYIKHP